MSRCLISESRFSLSFRPRFRRFRCALLQTLPPPTVLSHLSLAFSGLHDDYDARGQRNLSRMDEGNESHQ
ncbi:hypothetical protein L596_029575 [Steinernema carpocapsae]|uniref:Uncharacterized protein n=1 Tax=Steinernema carpocapsae TaxID=34508 RepID=A0A4U5LV20_STECR|nr:hypothetical protein L596_029575 [Steinernema carpocapsae]